jgi:hypothetical protein
MLKNETKKRNIFLITGWNDTGKDTVGKLIKDILETYDEEEFKGCIETCKFSEPIRKVIKRIFCIMDDEELETIKKNSINVRKLFISLAEAFKDMYGNNYFINNTHQFISNTFYNNSKINTIIITDCRFVDEVIEMQSIITHIDSHLNLHLITVKDINSTKSDLDVGDDMTTISHYVIKNDKQIPNSIDVLEQEVYQMLKSINIIKE